MKTDQQKDQAAFVKRTFIPLFFLLVLGILLINSKISFSIISAINNYLNTNLDLFFRASGLFCFGVMLICLALMLFIFSVPIKLSDKQRISLAISTLVLSFIFILIKTKENVPVFDDYTAIYTFLCKDRNSTSITEKLCLFFQPYFECRIPIPYLIVYFFSALPCETIPLNLMVSVNALVLLSIGILLFSSIKNKASVSNHLPWFLFFIFHSEFMQSSFSPLSGLCYNGVILFSLLSFRSMKKGTKQGNIESAIFSILAIFTFGNGLLVIPLLFIQTVRAKGIRKSMLIISPLVLAAVIYFSNYHPERPVSYPFHLGDFLFFIPVFLGSAFQFFYSSSIPFLTGIFILTLYIYAGIKRYDKTNPVLYYTLGFIILTAVVSASFRTAPSFEAALKLRYGVFSSFAILCSFFIAIELFDFQNNKKVLRLISGSAIIYNLLSANFFYPESVLTIQHNKAMLQEWKNTGDFEEVSAYYPGDLKSVLKCSYEYGYWEIDQKN